MKEKYLKLLDKQIEKLSVGDFDLDAWKSSTIHLLSIIFGDKDPKIKEIDHLKVDYGSWALRDATPKYKPIEGCKKKGREILEIAKDEIDLLGVTNQKGSLDQKLKEALSESQYAKFTLPTSTEKERSDVLKSLSKDKLIELLSNVYG